MEEEEWGELDVFMYRGIITESYLWKVFIPVTMIICDALSQHGIYSSMTPLADGIGTGLV